VRTTDSVVKQPTKANLLPPNGNNSYVYGGGASSNSRRDTHCPDWGFTHFPQSCQANGGQYCKFGMAASIHILYNSWFPDRPFIGRRGMLHLGRAHLTPEGKQEFVRKGKKCTPVSGSSTLQRRTRPSLLLRIGGIPPSILSQEAIPFLSFSSASRHILLASSSRLFICNNPLIPCYVRCGAETIVKYAKKEDWLLL
jgi:hypothetical protein